MIEQTNDEREQQPNETLCFVDLARDANWLPHRIPALAKTIWDACAIDVVAGTTGYRGGDSGHGGESFFSISDIASTDISVSIDGKPFEECKSVAISVGGDAELSSLIEALAFGSKALQRIAHEKTYTLGKNRDD